MQSTIDFLDDFMQKITSHLWFDKEAKEAAQFYTSTFNDSKIKSIATLHGTPSGDTDIVTIDLLGQEFTLMSAGPLFKFNPSVSFLVACSTIEETNSLFNTLSKGGNILMPLDNTHLVRGTLGFKINMVFLGS